MHSDSLTQISASLDIPYALLEKDYKEYEKPLLEGFMSTDSYYEHLTIHFGKKVEGDLFYKYFVPFSVNKLMLSLVDNIRAKGGRCVIGSNTFAPHYPYLFSSKVSDHFDAYYASHLMHISKPDKEFWTYIMDKEGYCSHDTLFIDDRKENIEGALSVGIDAFHYTSDEALLERFKEYF